MKGNYIGDKDYRNSNGTELLDFIKEYPFLDSPFKSNVDKYKETKLREITRFMSLKIQRYLSIHTDDSEILKFLSLKTEINDLDSFLKSIDYRDLIDAKTLKRSFEGARISDATLGVLRAFIKVVDHEEHQKHQIDRISGLYYLYNIHNTEPNTFQYSLLKIDPVNGAYIKYVNRSLEQVSERVVLKVIGKTKLLLRSIKGNHALIFYIYISPDIKAPEYLQGAFLYSNRSNSTIANAVVLERVIVDEGEIEETYNNFIPEREIPEIPESIRKEKKIYGYLTPRKNIQYFLLNKTKPIKPARYNNTSPFNFRRDVACYPSLNHTTALHYNRQRSYIGKYFIYFNERFSTSKPKVDSEFLDIKMYRNPFFSSVGRAILEIYEDKLSGVLKCKMISKKRSKESTLNHEGYVINHTLKTGDAIILAMYQEPERDRYINLHLNVFDIDKFIGIHNISYSLPNSLGSGTSVIVRQDIILRDYDDIKRKQMKTQPTSFNIPFGQVKSSYEKSILNYLSSNLTSRVIPPGYDYLKYFKPNSYEGLYRVYSWKNNAITMHLLKIYSNGCIVHVDAHNGIAHGYVEKNKSHLCILLKNTENGRTGFMSIKVDNGSSPYRDTKNYINTSAYLGTFAGVSRWKNEKSVASKIILEFLGKEEEIKSYKGQLISKDKTKEFEQRKNFMDDVIHNLKNGKSSSNSHLEFDDSVYFIRDLGKWRQKEEKDDK